MASVDWESEITAYLAKQGTTELSNVGELLANLGAACQDAAEGEIGMTFDEQTFTELYDGEGMPVIFLTNGPVTSLVSVRLNGQSLPCGGPYNGAIQPPFPLPQVIARGTLGSERDRSFSIQLTDGTAFDSSQPRNVQVTYTAGLSNQVIPLPRSLVQAVVIWAAYLFKLRDRIGLGTQTKKDQITSFTHDVPPDVERLLWIHERPVIA